MNFGGYHSFVETFPIAQAVENDQRFTVEVTANQRKTLYRDFAKTAEAFAGGEAVPEIRKYHEAYNASQAPRERYRKSQEYLASMPKRRDVVTPVPVTESDEM